jgi:hypothetical protein
LYNEVHPFAIKAIVESMSIKTHVVSALRDFVRQDLRPSHLILGGMIVVGALVNLLFAHGWTVWPLVAAFGILTLINEAADRNGQGIPPFQVYAFFLGAGAAWIVLVLVLCTIHPIVLILGMAAIFYRVAEALLKQRERDRLIAFRRAQGVCLHCGQVYDPKAVFCESCGEEPNPEEAILKRVAQIYRSSEDMARARAILGRRAAAGSPAAKEQALIARHHGGKFSPQSPLPKAAKLGSSTANKPKRG